MKHALMVPVEPFQFSSRQGGVAYELSEKYSIVFSLGVQTLICPPVRSPQVTTQKIFPVNSNFSPAAGVAKQSAAHPIRRFPENRHNINAPKLNVI
jgi:hypothetical protein